jgi:hypothetical protein
MTFLNIVESGVKHHQASNSIKPFPVGSRQSFQILNLNGSPETHQILINVF